MKMVSCKVMMIENKIVYCRPLLATRCLSLGALRGWGYIWQNSSLTHKLMTCHAHVQQNHSWQDTSSGVWGVGAGMGCRGCQGALGCWQGCRGIRALEVGVGTLGLAGCRGCQGPAGGVGAQWASGANRGCQGAGRGVVGIRGHWESAGVLGVHWGMAGGVGAQEALGPAGGVGASGVAGGLVAQPHWAPVQGPSTPIGSSSGVTYLTKVRQVTEMSSAACYIHLALHLVMVCTFVSTPPNHIFLHAM